MSTHSPKTFSQKPSRYCELSFLLTTDSFYWRVTIPSTLCSEQLYPLVVQHGHRNVKSLRKHSHQMSVSHKTYHRCLLQGPAEPYTMLDGSKERYFLLTLIAAKYGFISHTCRKSAHQNKVTQSNQSRWMK